MTRIRSLIFTLVLLLSLAGASLAAASLTITSATVAADGRSLTVNVSGIGTGPLLPATGATGFTVTDSTNGVAQKVVGTTEGASAVTATLSYQVNASDTVMISYAPGTLTDSAGTPNTMPALGPISVTNSSTQTAANLGQIASGNFASLPGIKGWYKAGAGVYKDAAKTLSATVDGDLVYTWADLSGNGNDAVQATSGSRPILKLTTNGIGGVPAINFNYRVLNIPSLWTATMNLSSTVIVVAKLNSGSSNALLYSMSGYYVSTSNSQATRSWINPDATYYNAVTNGGGYATQPIDYSTFENTIAFDGNTYANSVNKTVNNAGKTSSIGGSGSIVIGANAGGGNAFTGSIAEIIVCDQTLTPATRQAVENALLVKYGITISSSSPGDGDSIYNGLINQAYQNMPLGWVGFDASLSGRLLSDMAANVGTRITPLIDLKRPRNAAMLFGGTNDVNSATSSATAATVAASALTNITTWTRAVHAAGGKAIVGTLFPRSASTSDPIEMARLSINSSLRSSPATYGVDVLADMGNDPSMGQTGQEVPQTYFSDGLHPVAAGYTVGGRYFAQALATLDNGVFASAPTFGTPSQTAVTVSWPAGVGTGTLTYQLQRASDISGGPGVFANIGTAGTALTYSDSSLTGGATYWYQVKVTDSSAALTAPATTPVVTPTGGAATGGLLTAGTYYLTYTINNSSGETTISPESAQFTVATGNIPSVTLPTLGIGQWCNIYLTQAGGASGTETMYLRAARFTTQSLTLPNQAAGSPAAPGANTTGVLSNSSPASSVQMATTPTLTAPTPSFSSVTANSINVSWGAGSGGVAPLTYQLQRSPDNAAWSNVAGATISPFNDTGLAATTTYYYRVVVTGSDAATANGTSASQATSNALTQGVATVTAHTATTISLSSTAASGGTGGITYNWYRSLTGPVFDYTSNTNLVAGATSLTFNDSGLTPGTTYYYLIKAIDSSTAHAQSTVVTQMTVPAPPSATAFASNGVVALYWPATAGAQTYILKRGGSTIASGLGGLTYVDTGLTTGTSYSYSLDTVSTAGDTSADSSAIPIIAKSVSGTKRKVQ